MSFLLHATAGAYQIAIRLRNLVAVGYRTSLGAPELDCFKGDGDRHEEDRFVSNGAGNGIGFGCRGGHACQGRQGPAAGAFEPWDIAFGSSITNDYIFRGITQSNHKPSVSAYFEPRYNINPNLQLYAGLAGASISFANRAAAEIDVYGGIRPTIGMFAFDFGVWGYLYPGGQCFGSQGAPGRAIRRRYRTARRHLLLNGNFIKKRVSFYEGYAKVNYTFNDMFSVGTNKYYSPNFLNIGAWGNYASINAKFTAPSSTFGSSGLGMYISGEFGRQWLGTSDSSTAWLADPGFAGLTASSSRATTPGTSASASPTRCSRWIFATPTPTCPRAIATPSPAITPPIRHGHRHPDQSGGFGSSWCGAAGIVKLSADLTAMTNLK